MLKGTNEHVQNKQDLQAGAKPSAGRNEKIQGAKPSKKATSTRGMFSRLQGKRG